MQEPCSGLLHEPVDEMQAMWSEVVDNLVHQPRYAGAFAEATREGVAGTPGEGPYLHLWLQTQGDTILRAGYQTYGCPAAIASGEMLCLLLTGRATTAARTLTVRDLTAALHGLPEGKEHCPQLAIEALHRALNGDARLSDREACAAQKEPMS